MLQFTHCEQAFDSVPIPIWVLDIQNFRILWANRVGLEFWNAENNTELAAREMLDRAPEAVLVRLRQTILRIHAGETFQEDWTFFPKGKPMPVILHLQPIRWTDGQVMMLNQAVKVEEAANDVTIRALAMLRHAKATLVLVNADGTILLQNAGSVLEFGRSQSWFQWITDSMLGPQIIRQALEGNLVRVETTVRTAQGERTHAIVAHELRDPIGGAWCVLIQHFDVTERVAAERLAHEQFVQLRDQQREIFELSTPFLEVGAHTLALPLIGRIDEARANEITSRLLDMVAKRSIERVILDITGVISVESSNLLFLRRLVGGLKLLGAKPIVTGIRSDLARILAASDEGLSGITIRRSLADGLTSSQLFSSRKN
ncbi:MAG TPA: PAS domain-containing protein [Polyangium sp.]|nr:PAS domain-containing protein [Polyangium sp.]